MKLKKIAATFLSAALALASFNYQPFKDYAYALAVTELRTDITQEKLETPTSSILFPGEESFTIRHNSVIYKVYS